MYLHIGQGVMLRHDEILGIFDMDNASWAYKTREFLSKAEEGQKNLGIVTMNRDPASCTASGNTFAGRFDECFTGGITASDNTRE